MCKPMKGSSLMVSRDVIDLNFQAVIRSAVSSPRWRHEQWTEPVFATRRSFASTPVSPVCATLRWQLSSAKFFLLGPVSLHDVRAVELSRESARHRGLLALARTPALSLGHPRQDLAQHVGRRQRVAPVADLCRFRPRIDPRSTAALSPRRPGTRSGQHRLCTGFHDRRSVHDTVSLCPFHAQAACSEIAHAAGPARADSRFPAHYTGPHPRCQHARSAHSGTRCFLHHGSRLPQLRTALPLDLAWRLLCHPSAQELSFYPTYLASGRQEQRCAVRSNHHSALVLLCQGLSCSAPSHSLLGCRAGETAGVSHQQFHSSRKGDRRVVPSSLASRIVFQMDQTTSAHQGLLRNFGERCEDPDLDRRLQLPAGCHRAQTARSAHEPVHNAANSQRLLVPENTDKSSIFTQRLAFSGKRVT